MYYKKINNEWFSGAKIVLPNNEVLENGVPLEADSWVWLETPPQEITDKFYTEVDFWILSELNKVDSNWFTNNPEIKQWIEDVNQAVESGVRDINELPKLESTEKSE